MRFGHRLRQSEVNNFRLRTTALLQTNHDVVGLISRWTRPFSCIAAISISWPPGSSRLTRIGPRYASSSTRRRFGKAGSVQRTSIAAVLKAKALSISRNSLSSAEIVRCEGSYQRFEGKGASCGGVSVLGTAWFESTVSYLMSACPTDCPNTKGDP